MPVRTPWSKRKQSSDRFEQINEKIHDCELKPPDFKEYDKQELEFIAGQQGLAGGSASTERHARRDKNAMRARLHLEYKRAKAIQWRQALTALGAGVIGALVGVWWGPAMDDPAPSPTPVVIVTTTTTTP